MFTECEIQEIETMAAQCEEKANANVKDFASAVLGKTARELANIYHSIAIKMKAINEDEDDG